MANPGYVRSTDGNDVDNGSTWALANATITGAAADDAAGDTIYFSQAHSETTAGSISVAFGTNASPTKLVCANDAAEPPTAVATTAVIACTTAANITINGSLYAYGLTLRAGNGAAVNSNIVLATTAGDIQRWESCVFDINTTGGTSQIQVGSTANQQQTEVYWDSCHVKFANTASDGIAVFNVFHWRGGSGQSGTATPSDALIRLNATNKPGFVSVSGVDLSNFASTLNLVMAGASQGAKVVFRNCKMPASWSGSLVTTPSVGIRVELWNCSATDTNYAMWIEDYEGTIKHETTIVRTGGASDGDTPISWRMASTANAEWPAIILRSPEIFIPNTTTGASKTLTVEIAQDGTTTALNDDEIWLEVEYLGTSGTPLALFATDAKATFLTSAAAQTDSTEAWSGLGGSNKKQKLSVTFTPQEEGVYIARVCLAKASTTVFVDPLVTVT